MSLASWLTDLDTLELTITVKEYATVTGLVGGMVMNSSTYATKTFALNPNDSTEVIAKGLEITASNQRVSVYDANTEGVSDISIAKDSENLVSLYATGFYMLVFLEAGTYDIYINQTTHEVRVVKTA